MAVPRRRLPFRVPAATGESLDTNGVPPVTLDRVTPDDLPPPSHPDYAVALVDRVLDDAAAAGASDIHLHPSEDRWHVRLRVDGVLRDHAAVPRSDGVDPAVRLLSMTGLPTHPPAGPIESSFVRGGVHARCGFFPTRCGIRVAVRLFGDRRRAWTIDDLGLDAAASDVLRRLSHRTDGLVLVVGPAGSGKTTTIYASIRQIAGGAPPRSVVTVEDPIESAIAGVSQSQIDTSADEGRGGMTIAAAVRGVVRQDPDVLMVGEIRDGPTADAVLSASLTGHLCYSSMHAGGVGSALRRLRHLGIDAATIDAALSAIVVQRLHRSGGGADGPRARPEVTVVDFTTDAGAAILDAMAAGASRSVLDAMVEDRCD